MRLLLAWLAKLHVYPAKAALTVSPAPQDCISMEDHASLRALLRLTPTPH